MHWLLAAAAAEAQTTNSERTNQCHFFHFLGSRDGWFDGGSWNQGETQASDRNSEAKI